MADTITVIHGGIEIGVKRQREDAIQDGWEKGVAALAKADGQ